MKEHVNLLQKSFFFSLTKLPKIVNHGKFRSCETDLGRLKRFDGKTAAFRTKCPIR